MSDLPAPLITIECDLRGLESMPLLGERLLTSDFDARCNDAEWRAGVTLWWRAWQQVPAGSLPNDEPTLAGLAGYRRDPRGWRKVRDNALHGFLLCTDGRLYHPVLCALAAKWWTKRETWRRQKQGQRGGQPNGPPPIVHPPVQQDTQVDNSKRPPLKGKGNTEPNGSDGAAVRAMTVYDTGEALLTLDGTMKPASARALIAKLCRSHGNEAVAAAVEQLRSQETPPADCRSALVHAVTHGKANGKSRSDRHAEPDAASRLDDFAAGQLGGVSAPPGWPDN